MADSPGHAWRLWLLFGVLWGLGNLTFGLSVWYLGTSAKTKTLVWGGIVTLIISTMVIGYGNYLSV